jgi:hypothetical protein
VWHFPILSLVKLDNEIINVGDCIKIPHTSCDPHIYCRIGENEYGLLNLNTGHLRNWCKSNNKYLNKSSVSLGELEVYVGHYVERFTGY